MTTRRYLLTSGAALIFVAFITYAGVSRAQMNDTPYCSTNTPTVNVNQDAVFTAYGGSGSYNWSANNYNAITNPNGSQFTVSFPEAGTYSIQVRSNGQTNSCSVTVVNNNNNYNSNYNYNYDQNNSFGALSCLPATQSVSLGQTAYFTASGGNGNYNWTVPELALNNPTGTGVYVTYATPGLRTVTLSSGGAYATCSVNVIGSTYVQSPGLPNTGGGYGHS